MSARNAILKRVSGQLDAAATAPGALPRGQDVIDARISAHPPNTIPARSDLDPAAQLDLFVNMAQMVDTEVTRLTGWAALPAAVADAVAKVLASNDGQNSVLKCAPHPDLERLSWAAQDDLSIQFGVADATDYVALSRAYAGCAESGTLVLLSGPQSPTALNFLPDTHFVAVATSEITGSYEEMWARLRTERGPDNFMPRCVNWVTGPSRTADIEQTMLKGVHGPRRLHIFLIDDSA